MYLSGIKTRWALLRAYCSPGHPSVAVADFVRHGLLRPPCTVIGPRYVESIREEHDDLVVSFRGIPTPLYWPKRYPMFDLYKVATETFDQSDWHFYEVPETVVQVGDTVLDCGAAEGMFALRVLGRAGRMALFEPLASWAPILRRTFADRPDVEVASLGLSDIEGRAEVEGELLRGALVKSDKGAIPVTTIDRWVTERGWRIDYIKADLEGFEHRVIRGAAETIRRDRPKIAITVYHPGNDWRWVLRFVRELVPSYAYRIKGISNNDGTARPVMLHLWPETPRC